MIRPSRFGAGIWLACCAALRAQTLPPDAPGSRSGEVEKSLRRVEAPSLDPALPRIEMSVPRPGKSASPEKRVQVSRVLVTGNQALSLEEIRPALPAPGERTLGELYDAADRVTAAYRSKGYPLAYAYLPQGDRSAGEVEIAVVEGWIDRIVLRGNVHFGSDFLLGRFERMREPGPLRLEDLERELLLVNEIPTLDLRAFLRPGVRPGSADLHLEAEDRMPLTVAADVDNYGAEAVGRIRGGLTAGFHDLWGEGHAVSLRGVSALDTTDGDLAFGRADYLAPLGSGTRLAAWGAFYDYEAEKDVTVLEPTGDGNVFGASLGHPFRRGTRFSLWGEIGAEAKSLRQELIGDEVAHDRLRILMVGIRTEIEDGWAGRWVGSLRCLRGIGGLAGGLEDDDPEASRPGADGEFTAVQLRLYRLQTVAPWIRLIGRIDVQHAAEPLVVSEQFVLGGHDSVRGYPPFEFMGDRGYTATIEARFKLPFLEGSPDPFDGDVSAFDLLQIVAFVDTGEAIREDPAAGERRAQVLTGGGVGFRIEYPGAMALRVDVAWPLTDVDPSTDDELIVYVGVQLNLR